MRGLPPQVPGVATIRTRSAAGGIGASGETGPVVVGCIIDIVLAHAGDWQREAWSSSDRSRPHFRYRPAVLIDEPQECVRPFLSVIDANSFGDGDGRSGGPVVEQEKFSAGQVQAALRAGDAE